MRGGEGLEVRGGGEGWKWGWGGFGGWGWGGGGVGVGWVGLVDGVGVDEGG